MKSIAVACLFTATLFSTAVQARSVTFYADGAMVELELAAGKGTVDIALPSAMVEGSLRIRPDKGTAIQQVEIFSAPSGKEAGERDLDTLIEQKQRLNDRLQALATREEIFKTAAKSQSGKAPRKTKTNPDPLQSIRQGTEFAIAQLEAVYTARRKTEQEIRRLENRIAAAHTGRGEAGSIARVKLSPAKGKITVRYALSRTGWIPRYDIHLNGDGHARIHLSGRFPGGFAGYLMHASPVQLADIDATRAFPAQSGSGNRLASFMLPVTDERFGTGVQTAFSCLLSNTSAQHLPAGEAGIYRKGEYVGSIRFEGISSGRTRKISMGTN